MVNQKLHGRMSVKTAEKVLTNMLDVDGLEVVILDQKTKRDVRDSAKLASLRRKHDRGSVGL